jgi:hypothetical protein
MTPFPSSFPLDSIQIVIGHIRKVRVVDHGTLANAGWEVLGYALAQTVGGPAVIYAAAEPFDLAESLGVAVEWHAPQGVGAPAGLSIPWALIATELAGLVARWLLNRK